VAGRVILVCGLPGSGKTTVARQLAAELRAVRMCPDEWMDALDIDLWDQPGRGRVEGLQWRLTLDLLRLDVIVIIEWGLWTRGERDELRQQVRAADGRIELRFLDVPVDELWRRLEARNAVPQPAWTVIEREHLLEWAAEFEAPTAEEVALYDAPVGGARAAHAP
jgi:predicted kinase